MKSTARKGDPGNASRGQAVDRARKKLGDVLDEAMDIIATTQDDARIALLADRVGTDVLSMRRMIEDATIDDFREWEMLVKSGNRDVYATLATNPVHRMRAIPDETTEDNAGETDGEKPVAQ